MACLFALCLTILSTASLLRAQGDEGQPHLLVLSGFGRELSPLLAKADIQETRVINGRSFSRGRLEGHDVVLALIGPGLENSARWTEQQFRIQLSMFQGVLSHSRGRG